MITENKSADLKLPSMSQSFMLSNDLRSLEDSHKVVVLPLLDKENLKIDDVVIKTALKIVSLEYRLKMLKKEDSTTVKILLKEAFIRWKSHIDHYFNKEVTEAENALIEKLSLYGLFAKLLLKSPKVQDECFKLIFRDHFPLKPLVQFFEISLDLNRTLIARRVGFFHKFEKEILKIEKNKTNQTKDIQLKINANYVSILDESQEIALNHGEKLTWKQIKKVWEEGKKVPSAMEIFEDLGMLYYRPQGMKIFSQRSENETIDLKEDHFWEKKSFPKFLTLSKERLEKELFIKIPEDKPYVVTIESTCIDPLFVDDAHGASTIYIPTENGDYQMLPFGKYAAKFPQKWYEKLLFVGNSVQGELTYPDPTPFYRHRLHAISPKCITKEDFEALMIDYTDIWYFQFAGNNCSAEFQQIHEKRFGKKEEGGETPNYFRYPLLKSRFFVPFDTIFGFIAWMDKAISPKIARFFLHFIHLISLSFRKITRINPSSQKYEEASLLTNEFCKTFDLYVPGILVNRIKNGEIPGIIKYGDDVWFKQSKE